MEVTAEGNGINTQTVGCGSQYKTVFAGKGYKKSRAEFDCPTDPFKTAPNAPYNKAPITTDETDPLSPKASSFTLRLFESEGDVPLYLNQIIEFRTGFNRYKSADDVNPSIKASSTTKSFEIFNSNVVTP